MHKFLMLLWLINIENIENWLRLERLFAMQFDVRALRMHDITLLYVAISYSKTIFMLAY